MKKITVKNFKTEFPKLDKRKLNSNLKEQSEFVKDIIDFYGEDKNITTSVDNFLNELNDYLRINDFFNQKKEKKTTVKTKPKKKSNFFYPKAKTAKPKQDKKKETKPEPRPKSKNNTRKKKKNSLRKTIIANGNRFYRTSKKGEYENADTLQRNWLSITADDHRAIIEFMNTGQGFDWLKKQNGELWTVTDNNGRYYLVPSKLNKENEVKTKINAKEVNSIDMQISIIKSFYLLLDKKVTRKRILNLYKKIEKSALEKTIRKHGKHAKLIEKISQILAKEYNTGKANVLISLSKKEKENLKSIAYSEKQLASVKLLKKYPSVSNKGSNAKNKLLEEIRKANINANDPYYNQIVDIKRRLKEGKNTVGYTQLRGFGRGSKKKANNLQGLGATELISSSELSNVDFNIYEFSGKWEKIIGRPSNPFVMMIHGQAKGGKSSFALQFAKYLSQNKNQKVAYFSAEEGVNHTFVEKLKRFNVINNNFYISEKFPDQLRGIDVLFIDSINYADIKIEYLKAIKEKYPNLTIVYVMHETKGGVFKGGSEWEHFPDIIIKVDAGVAETERSRFNEYGKIRVF